MKNDESTYDPIVDDYYYQEAKTLYIIQILKSKLKGNYADKGYPGIKVFLPSPKEIKERCAMLVWLKECGFHEKFIGNVMQFDYPSFRSVQDLIDQGWRVVDIEKRYKEQPAKPKRVRRVKLRKIS